ncbi:SDR family NAD(P)-dependent oxidoreductase [Frigidibacter oleivorans]|uniref:SDR family NAD(P)-dependent oxidoreductase n=1 Tax=Frigidibacter oleivorans TaxID=2487129 RepID=UPI000F8ED3FC|nr:SDR family NAD(P)-dependent oxidoreductase [Frigidibacter oleivorans]
MRSLVIGASGGIGAALAAELALRGETLGLSRSADGIDVTDEASIADALARLDAPFDLIVVATGQLGTPEKSLRGFEAAELARQVAVNAAGPLLVLKHGLRLLHRDRRAVFAALSARVGSIGDNSLGGWYSYRAAKAALNQLLRSAAIEVGRTHPQAVIAGLHPGTVETAFTAGYAQPKVSPALAAARLVAVMDALGPEQSGGFVDYSGATIPW